LASLKQGNKMRFALWKDYFYGNLEKKENGRKELVVSDNKGITKQQEEWTDLDFFRSQNGQGVL
jgi:hypothetical protein